MLKVLGIIPARGGSKGIENKNMAEAAGKPLIYYTIIEALKSKHLDRVILSTEDDTIIKYGKSLGIDVPFVRPAHLAKDDSSMFSVVEHTVNWLKENEDYTADAVMLLQPTNPLRTVKHIDGAIFEFEKQNVDSLVSVSEPQEHPMEMVSFKGKEMKFAIEKRQAAIGRQNYSNNYFLNGAIYITKIDTLMKSVAYIQYDIMK